MKNGSRRIEAFEAAMSDAARHRVDDDLKSAYPALECAHVLGQLDFVPHLRVHWQMFRAGWAAGDRREMAGQLRLPHPHHMALALLGGRQR